MPRVKSEPSGWVFWEWTVLEPEACGLDYAVEDWLPAYDSYQS